MVGRRLFPFVTDGVTWQVRTVSFREGNNKIQPLKFNHPKKTCSQQSFQEIPNRTHRRDPSTWVSNGSSNLLRGPLVRSHSNFDGIFYQIFTLPRLLMTHRNSHPSPESGSFPPPSPTGNLSSALWQGWTMHHRLTHLGILKSGLLWMLDRMGVFYPIGSMYAINIYTYHVYIPIHLVDFVYEM